MNINLNPIRIESIKHSVTTNDGESDMEVVLSNGAMRVAFLIEDINYPQWIAFAQYSFKQLRYLNTWHGIPIKTVGNGAEGRKDYDFSYIDYFCVSGDYEIKLYNLDIPTGYVTEEGISLGRWYRSMRDRYQDGSLTGEKIEALERIGMQWSSVFSRRWAACYELARKYFEEHGDLVVPKTYVTEDGTRLQGLFF